MTKEDLKQAFIQGFVEIEINGKKVTVFCRDPHLSSALYLAEAKQLL